MAIEKLKRHISSGIDRIQAELIKARGRTILSEIHKIINSAWSKEELSEEWKGSIFVPIYKKGDKTDCGFIEACHFCQLHTKFNSTSCSTG